LSTYGSCRLSTLWQHAGTDPLLSEVCHLFFSPRSFVSSGGTIFFSIIGCSMGRTEYGFQNAFQFFFSDSGRFFSPPQEEPLPPLPMSSLLFFTTHTPPEFAFFPRRQCTGNLFFLGAKVLLSPSPRRNVLSLFFFPFLSGYGIGDFPCNPEIFHPSPNLFGIRTSFLPSPLLFTLPHQKIFFFSSLDKRQRGHRCVVLG